MMFKSLLPLNASPAERALEEASTWWIAAIPNDIRETKEPKRCLSSLLPWLAWEYAVDSWEPDWTGNQKRQVISDAAYVHQHRGTAGAVRRSLAAVGFPTTVVEWWQESPRAMPYTFRVLVYSDTAISALLYDQIRRQTDKSKNLRSWLSSIDVISDIGSTGEFFIGGAVTFHVDVDIEGRETDHGKIL
ncbi:phage tail protein I [Rouxiella sp. T17]|uniref:phage tail protein I n=1 Tax=Rouxiella sp. T17 TaxID=3085684 RepID=UPI002FC8FAF7